jgi:hypothetical protein
MYISLEVNKMKKWFKKIFKWLKTDGRSWFFLISGLIIWIISLCFGLYIGVWECLIGGIVDIVNGFQTVPMEAYKIAIGVAKFMFAGIVGWASFAIGLVFGKILINKA